MDFHLVGFVMLLLLYITLDGCGWSSSFSLAAPVMVFSRQLSNNGSRDNGNDGAGKVTNMISVHATNHAVY